MDLSQEQVAKIKAIADYHKYPLDRFVYREVFISFSKTKVPMMIREFVGWVYDNRSRYGIENNWSDIVTNLLGVWRVLQVDTMIDLWFSFIDDSIITIVGTINPYTEKKFTSQQIKLIHQWLCTCVGWSIKYGTSYIQIPFNIERSSISITILPLPPRITNALRRKDIFTIDDLWDNIERIRNGEIRGIGQKSIKEINDVMYQYWYDYMASI